MVASNIQHESMVMVNVAQETQKDSVRLKTLTRVATVYLPATLIAVSASQWLTNNLKYLIINVINLATIQLQPCAAGAL